MTQVEDTELRDLVIDALERNGSLAKVRAMLRANIFLAFEGESDSKKHNPNLDKILEIPEGLFSMSLIQEFLEYCNLNSTNFVYVSETCRGKHYSYEGRKTLAEALPKLNCNQANEPILVTIIKSIFKSHNVMQCRQDNRSQQNRNQGAKNGFHDDQNCTYIVHDDSNSLSSQSQSLSDNSSDEKNKSMLRLQLDNSDTDTSSDSTREKTASEYIANENIIINADSDDDSKKSNTDSPDQIESDLKVVSSLNNELQHNVNKIIPQKDLLNPSYINSDSFLELQSNNTYSMKQRFDNSKICDKKDALAKNFNEVIRQSNLEMYMKPSSSVKQDVTKESTSNSPLSSEERIPVLDNVLSDYSYEFSISPLSTKMKHNNITKPSDMVKLDSHRTNDSPHYDSNSSRSSVSISDVAELIENSDLRSPCTIDQINFVDHTINTSDPSSRKKITRNSKYINLKSPRDDFDDISGSTIPSLSNLSLDFHSD